MKQFSEIPATRPTTPLLDSIDQPRDLRALDESQLQQVANELREYLLYCVGQSGGHFGAGLGVVELTIALHYVYNTPDDRIVFDVGHQAYPHKILTGRREQMLTMRQQGGLAAFPSRDESIFDTFGVGHSSTSISAALGMAVANGLLGNERKAVAIIGDGAATAGMAFEALADAGHQDHDMLVILNDNDMSISESVGGLSAYFTKILASKTYSNMREGSKKVLKGLGPMKELVRRAEEHMKGMVAPGTLFEELGFNYIGPVDGHDLPRLVKTLQNVSTFKGPQFLHIVTKKGKGFIPAEEQPIKYHAIAKIPAVNAIQSVKRKTYSNVFGEWLCAMAEKDSRLTAITPAMREGSDLIEFSKRYKSRYFDVAIAEQHAVTLAAGMACEQLKPVVAIYSTFLQRAYDQLIHDVALQNLDVLFAIDRAGLVGEDGPTHAGAYDVSYLNCIPNMVVLAPRDETELQEMLSWGYAYAGPVAVRYPRGGGRGHLPATPITTSSLELGKAERLSQGSRVAILALGSMVDRCESLAESLDATVVNLRFAKPIDFELLAELKHIKHWVTVEEGATIGGVGSRICQWLQEQALDVRCLNLGLPDQFIEHGDRETLLSDLKLDAEGIKQQVLDFLER